MILENRNYLEAACSSHRSGRQPTEKPQTKRRLTFYALVFKVVDPRIVRFDDAVRLSPSVVTTQTALRRVVEIHRRPAVEGLFVEAVLLAISAAEHVGEALFV